MSWRGLFLLLLGSLLLGAPAGLRGAPLEADWILYNGKILTANTEDPAQFATAQAVAIYDGKFVVVGTNQQALETAGPNTRRIDLAGKTVLPGMIETHIHVHSQANRHHLGKDDANETDPPVRWTSKEEALAGLRTLASFKEPGEWIIVSADGTTPQMVFGDKPAAVPSLEELDRAVPDNPITISLWGEEPFLANSRVLKVMLERYPKGVEGMVRDSSGQPTGLLRKSAARVVQEFWPPLSPEKLAQALVAYKRELQEPAARGLTTVATRVDMESMRVYELLDEREEMPIRLAYSTEMASYHPLAELLFRRVPARAGHGTPWLWLAGATVGIVEGTRGPDIAAACVNAAYKPDATNFAMWKIMPWGSNGDCRLGSDPEDAPLRNFFLQATRYGWAVNNVHINGDRGLDQYLDLLEEANRRYGGVAELRTSADHCGYVNDTQAKRAQRLGISFTCTPISFENAERSTVGAYATLYDKERAADAYAPFRRLVSSGMKPSAHCEGHQDWTFTCMKLMITRKDQKTGSVWGPQQRIDRREALYTFTRWAAWHVWKEKYIGSIEPGKWADLVVIDKDFMTVPEEELSGINPLLTVAGGKVAYSNPNFAASVGVSTVGFQAPPDWWRR